MFMVKELVTKWEFKLSPWVSSLQIRLKIKGFEEVQIETGSILFFLFLLEYFIMVNITYFMFMYFPDTTK